MKRTSVFLIVIAVLSVSSAYAGITERVSVSSDGVQGNIGSEEECSISADGKFVAFQSRSYTLASRAKGWNIFVHDRLTGETELISKTKGEITGYSDSFNPSISADGRFVAFSSMASHLVIGDNKNREDVFVYDRQTGKTECVSVSNEGVIGNSFSETPSISADGRFVAFSSNASNLVIGDINKQEDVFVHDRRTRKTTLVSVTSGGKQGNLPSYMPSISADGRFVAFKSEAYTLMPDDLNCGYYWPKEIFVHDMLTGKTECITISEDGVPTQGNHPSLSADGRFVVFCDDKDWKPFSFCSNVYVRDMQTNKTKCITVSSDGEHADRDCTTPSISADGRFVAYQSFATNLVNDDKNKIGDIYIYDMITSRTKCVSESTNGVRGNLYSATPSISADGRFIAFHSYAYNLVNCDTNKCGDTFVHELTNVQGTIELSNFTGDITAAPVTVDLGKGLDPIGLNLDSNGNFSIWDPPCGTFDIRIKASHWLAKTINDIAINDDTDLGTTTLTNGDVLGNNNIDLLDLKAVRAAYGSFPGDSNWNELADVDGNGEVDLTDLKIIRSNYGLIGE